MKELYLSLFFSLLGSLVAYRLVCSSAWLSKALRNLAPTLYVWFMLGFPLFLLGPMAAIYSNVYTVFTILNLFFICFLFLYLIFYFYGRRESEEVYTWLLLNTKIRVTVVTFLILSLVAFWYFSFLEVTLDIILSLSLVEILDFLSTRSLSVLSPLIVNFYWLLYSYTWAIKYVSSMPILLLISNGIVSGVVIRGFYSSTIGLDMLSFLLETGKVADCSIAMFRAIGAKTSFASIIAERPSTTSFLKQVSTWEKTSGHRFHIKSNRTFFEKEVPWSEVRRTMPFMDLEKFICGLTPTETTLHHKFFAGAFVFTEINSGIVGDTLLKQMLSDLNIDTVGKATAYGFKVTKLDEIAKLTCKDINPEDIENARKQYLYAESWSRKLPANVLAQMSQCIRDSYSMKRVFPGFVLTESWHKNFPPLKDNIIMPRTALLVQQEWQIQHRMKTLALNFQTFDAAQPTFSSNKSLLLRKDEFWNASSLIFSYEKTANPIVAFEAAGVGKGDAVLRFANGEKIDCEFTQNHYGYIGAYFSEINFAEKDILLMQAISRLVVEKHFVSSARVNLYLGWTQQSADEIINILGQGDYLDEAIVFWVDKHNSANEVISASIKELQVPRLIAQKEMHKARLEKYLAILDTLDKAKIIENTMITTAANFKQ